MSELGDGRAVSGGISELLEVLDLQPIDDDHFRGRSSNITSNRLFGGHVAAQALIACGRTVLPGRTVATTQSTFLRGGDATRPLDLEVERLGDGRSFSFRRVVVRQGDKPILTALATFHTGDEGPEHASPGEPGDPLAFANYEPQSAPMISDAFELRQNEVDEGASTKVLAFRTTEPLPDDPLVRAAVIQYASDIYILEVPLRVHGRRALNHDLDVASIDHAMWFHHVPSPEDWLEYTLTTPVASAGLTLVRGEMHRLDGTLVASLTQLGMMRYPRSRSTPPQPTQAG